MRYHTNDQSALLKGRHHSGNMSSPFSIVFVSTGP